MKMRAGYVRVQAFSFVHLLGLAVMSSGAELPTEDPDEGALHPLLADVINQGPYKPKWASLVTHPLPDWFRNDKVGLSAHWGPYAVPGWTPRKDTPYGVAYAEWYWVWLGNNQAVKDYHKQHYGDAVYDDFIDGTKNLVTGETDGFFAKKLDADGWMQLFKEAGVKYFFITSKHHDGFCIWDSKYTDRNAAKMGSRRDLYGEMVKAARKHGLRVGLYYSFYEWNNPIYRNKGDISGYKGCKPLKDEDGDGNAGEYVDDFMVPQIKELIDNYHPDYLCFDGEWEHGYLYWRARQIMAYYFNQAKARGQEVVINDRFGQKKEGTSDTRGVYGDFYHVEYHANVDRTKPWAMWRGFGNSYGYNRNEHPDNILSVKDTIRMVLDCASEGGNIEFNIGPKADGTLADFEVDRLKAMGQWLKVNGEGVYNTRRGPIKRADWGVSTISGNRLYLHVVDWPKDNILPVTGLVSSPLKTCLLHERSRQLDTHRRAANVLTIDLSGSRPFEHASTICLEFDDTPEVSDAILPDAGGKLTLRAEQAALSGGIRVERKSDNIPNIGFWSNTDAVASWKAQIPEGRYTVTLDMALEPGNEGQSYRVTIGNHVIETKTNGHTGGWEQFKPVVAGKFEGGGSEVVPVTIKADAIADGKFLMNLRSIILTRIE